MGQIQLGSMQDKFRVEVRRCLLNHELEAQAHYRSRRITRVAITPPQQENIHTI
jgi:hypothetical protein